MRVPAHTCPAIDRAIRRIKSSRIHIRKLVREDELDAESRVLVQKLHADLADLEATLEAVRADNQRLRLLASK
jgi:hypothetical protein